MNKPEAFLLFGGFTSGKYPMYLRDIRRRGLQTLVIDQRSERSDIHLAYRSENPEHILRQIDDFCFVAPSDHDRILEKVVQWSDDYNIAGVLTIREIFVEPAGLVADFLGLPSPGLRASRICRNKYLQRYFLRQWSPDFVVVPPSDRARIARSYGTYPMVIKPVARAASSGVELVLEQDSLVTLAARYPEDEVLLFEECVRGREFSVESILSHGQVVFSNITQKRTNESGGRYFVETAHTVPATNVDEAEGWRIRATNSSVLDRLDFRDGIAHAEYKMTDSGDVYLMEIAARNPGDGILPLYYLATGVPMERSLVDVALGVNTSYPGPRRFARQVYLNHEPGYLKDVCVSAELPVRPLWYQESGVRPPLTPGLPADAPRLHELLIEKSRGDKLEEIRKSGDRCGSVIFDAPTPHELDALEQTLTTALRVHTAQG